MNKPEFKLFPCIFCTLGFNSYVAVRKLSGAATNLLKKDENSLESKDSKTSEISSAEKI